ncbi:MAG TPA: RDD family protein, partial [Gaiellaceae bacterium]|nr:RDD family protein [Gaiellaceae bacterium]
METGEEHRRPGVADVIGGAAVYPVRVAARAWRGRLETAADEVLSAPETARIVDRALAGPLPEELARSLVRHRVVERVVQELAATGELERLLEEALASPQSLELVDRVLASDEMRRALQRAASGPEVRGAIASQSAGLAEQVVARVRVAATGLDRRTGRRARPGFAGVGSRGVALAIDAAATIAICAGVGAVAGLVGSLVGGVGSHELAGALLAVGAALLTGGYFTLFWSAAGQTPGMRQMHLRVRSSRADGRLTVGRALARTIGLAL